MPFTPRSARRPPPRLLAALAVLASLGGSGAAPAGDEPRDYIYATADEFDGIRPLLERPGIAGAEVIYAWRDLEPRRGRYDFSAIRAHLNAVDELHQELFVQVQDRFFAPEARHAPRYLLERPRFGGGLAPQVDDAEGRDPEVVGWVAMHWNPAVRQRYQSLLDALARSFDGRIAGVVLPETAAEVDRAHDRTGFTCDGYFEAELENYAHAIQVFRASRVVLYSNFWPCEWADDHGYMGRTFEHAAASGSGLGGPDIVPDWPTQMANSYVYFHDYRDRLGYVAMAVQEPTLEYVNPKTGKTFTRDEIVGFARDYLGVDAIFWSSIAPWLASPDVAP